MDSVKRLSPLHVENKALHEEVARLKKENRELMERLKQAAYLEQDCESSDDGGASTKARTGLNAHQTNIHDSILLDDFEGGFLVAAFDSFSHLLFVQDKEGRFRMVNKAAARFYGLSAGELKGRSLESLHPDPEEAARFQKENEQVIDARRPMILDASSFTNAAGRVRNFCFIKTPFPLENPSEYWVLSLAVDVSEDVLDEAVIKQNTRLFRELIEGTDGLVIRLDAQGRVTYVNHRSYALLGCLPDECLDRPALDFIPPEDREEVDRAVRELVSSRRSFQYETRVESIDGVERILLWTFNIQEDGDGKLQGLFGIANDVTERKAIGAALKESEARFRQLADNTNDVFWIRDFETHKMLFLNRAFEDIWGRPCEEVIDDPTGFARFVHPDDYEAVIEALKQQAAKEKWFNMEYRVVRPDGTIRWVLARNWPVMNENGRPVRVVGVAQDITDRKKVEEALVAAKEEAESANRAKSEFLANLSHELRTPMNAVMGLTDLVLESDLEPSQREVLKNVRDAAERLLDVINMVIELSYIEAGRVRLAEQPYHLRETLKTVIEELSPAAAARELDLRLALDPETPALVVGDYQRLTRVLTILIENAFKFTEKGAVRVEAGPARDENGAKRLVFSVTDTGIGIPADRLTDIFNSFYQVDSSATRRYGGLGIGLNTAYRLVQLMGGELGVESREGAGSRFTFSIPLKFLED